MLARIAPRSKPWRSHRRQRQDERRKGARSAGWLAAKYFASDEFNALDPISQRTRRLVIESCLAEPHSDDDPEPMRNCPLEFVTSRKIKRLRDLKAGLPGAANNRRKYLSSMFGWAIEV